MPRPKLPPKQVREIIAQVRFNEPEYQTILKRAKAKAFKSFSQYVRSLIQDDLMHDKYSTYGMPQLEAKSQKKGL